MMKYLLMLFCALSFLLAITQTKATDVPPLITLNEKQQPAGSGEIIGQLPGSGQALAVQGDLVFVGFGNELAIIDVTDKTMPEEIGRLTIDQLILDIAVSTKYVYLATASGLQIVDFTSTENPMWLGLASSLPINRLVLEMDYIYALSTEGLLIFDYTNPIQLTKIGHFKGKFFTPLDLDIFNNYAFVVVGASDNLLIVLDTTNKAEPFEVHSETEHSNRIAITHNRYMVINNGCSQTCSTWFGISSWNSDTWEITFIGVEHYYFSESSLTLETDSIYAYVGKDIGLLIYSIYPQASDIGTPLRVSYFDVGNVRDVVRKENYLYVVSEDWNNFPNPPREGGFYILPAPPLYHAYMPFVPVDSSLLIRHNK